MVIPSAWLVLSEASEITALQAEIKPLVFWVVFRKATAEPMAVLVRR